MSLIEKMNQRIADDAFAKFARNGCLIESDEKGPQLWNMARKAAVTGLAALTLFTAVAPTYAHDVKLPTQEIASVYHEEAIRALAEGGTNWLGRGLAAIKSQANPHVAEFTATSVEDAQTLFGDLQYTSPFASSTCVVSYSDNARIYEDALNLPEGFEIGRYQEMRAISYCSVWGLMDSKSFGQHAHTIAGAIPLSEVMTSLATAKYDQFAFDDVYDFQTAVALSALRSGEPAEQMEALWKLEALGEVHGYVHSEEGRALSSASIQNLVDMTDALARLSQHAVQKAGLDVEQVATAELPELVSILQTTGLPGAAKAVERAAQTGLSAEKGYYSSLRPANCEEKAAYNSGHQSQTRHQRRRTAWCNVEASLTTKSWAAEGRYVEGSFQDFANALLGTAGAVKPAM